MSVPTTLIWFESAKRLAATLADLADVLGPRPAAITRELTKAFEEVRRGSLAELAATIAKDKTPRGEIAIVVGPPGAEEGGQSDEAVDDALRLALETMGPSAAAASVAQNTSRSRKELYQRALALRSEGP